MKLHSRFFRYGAAVLVSALFACSLPVFCSCEEKKPEKPAEPDPEDPEQPEEGSLTAYFYDYLRRGTAYTGSETFASEELEDRTEAVWKAWVEAHGFLAEEKLGELTDLSAGRSSRWNLPSELEPNAVMNYYWGSKGSRPEDGYPLFLYLHGSGDRNAEWATGLHLCRRFEDSPSAYFIPQIPNVGNYYRWWQKAKQYAWEKLLRLAFVSGEVDPNKVYFFGISEGGYGSQRLASFYADYLAGAGPMAGGEPLKNAPVENCANTAFSLRTGANDGGFYRNTLTAYTKEEFERLQGEHPRLFEHWIELIPGAGHGIDYNPTTPWLRQHTRNPYPKYVNWENFEMDNLYRKGFYNLQVLERSNPDMNSRTSYRMQIEGNVIDLRVDVVTYTVTETDPVYGIQMKFSKTYAPATYGMVRIYLCDELVDLSQPVVLKVNGTEVHNGPVALDEKNLVNSCALFFDPERLYPASLEVDLSKLQ